MNLQKNLPTQRLSLIHFLSVWTFIGIQCFTATTHLELNTCHQQKTDFKSSAALHNSITFSNEAKACGSCRKYPMVLVTAWASELIPQLTWFPICSSKSLTTRILMGNTSCRVSNYTSTTPSLVTVEQTLSQARTLTSRTQDAKDRHVCTAWNWGRCYGGIFWVQEKSFWKFSFHCKMAEKNAFGFLIHWKSYKTHGLYCSSNRDTIVFIPLWWIYFQKEK